MLCSLIVEKNKNTKNMTFHTPLNKHDTQPKVSGTYIHKFGTVIEPKYALKYRIIIMFQYIYKYTRLQKLY